MKSNNPDSQAYGSFKGGLYTICESCTLFNDLKVEIKTLVDKLLNQNFNVNKIKSSICSFLKSKPACIHKFCRNINLNDLVR